MTWRRLFDTLFNFAARIVGVILVTLLASQLTTTFRSPPQTVPQDLPTRIQTLTDSLNTAAQNISDIEKEIEKRRQLVLQLQDDAKTAQELAQVNKNQAEAVAQSLHDQLEKNHKENFLTDQALALFYTFLGVVLAELYHWWQRRRGKE